MSHGYISSCENQIGIIKNKVYLASILENIWTLAYPIKINEKEFDDNHIEFISKYLNHPEKLNLILEENKNNILYSFADSSDKPQNINPEEYYNALVIVTNVLYNETGHYIHNANMYHTLYHSNTLGKICDSIIYYSILEQTNDGFFDESIDNVKGENDELLNQIMSYISYYYDEDINIANKVLNDLIKEWDKIIEENPKDFEEDGNKFVSYFSLFKECCSPESLYIDMLEYYGKEFGELIEEIEANEELEL